MTQQLVLKETDLFTGFQPWGRGAESTPAQSPVLHETSTPLAPHQAVSQNHAQSSLSPYLFLSRLCKQVSIPSGRCSCGFQSDHPLAVALSFRIWGTLFSASMLMVQGNMCHVTMDHGRHTSPESGFSVRTSEKPKSVVQHSQPQFSSKHFPQIRAWLGRSLHSSISSHLTPFPPARLLPSHLSVLMVEILHTRPHDLSLLTQAT